MGAYYRSLYESLGFWETEARENKKKIERGGTEDDKFSPGTCADIACFSDVSFRDIETAGLWLEGYVQHASLSP